MSTSALLESPAPLATEAKLSLADLVLLRLLPEKKSISETDLRKDIAIFFRHAPRLEEIKTAVAALKADGFITPKGQRATDAGRAKALQLLGIEKLPPRANWNTVKAKYLVPRTLGLPFDSAEYAKADNGEKLAALLLKRKLDLPNAGHTLNTVLEAFIARALGEAVSGDPISKKEAQKHFPRVLLNVPRAGKKELFAAILSGAIGNGHTKPEPEPEPEPEVIDEAFDLTDFANTVKSAARKCETGRFGGYKVFINHVWNLLRDEPRFAPLGLAGFKAMLVEANRENLLTLRTHPRITSIFEVSKLTLRWDVTLGGVCHVRNCRSPMPMCRVHHR